MGETVSTGETVSCARAATIASSAAQSEAVAIPTDRAVR
jgi:hypothetical protein